MVVLPGVLGCRPLRRTVQVRLGTNTLRLPAAVARWQAHLRGLATAIHEISGQEARFQLLRISLPHSGIFDGPGFFILLENGHQM